MELNNLLESANPWKSLQSDAARLTSKWEKTGLLEGMNSEVETNNMSMILENQAKQLVVEQSQTGGDASFATGTGATWAGVALPLVRKVFGQLASKEFVSVQPMNLPSGLVFYLDFQYGTAKSPFGEGDSMYGTTDGAGAASGGLYGAGRFTYSENQFSAAFAGASADISSASLAGAAAWEAVGYDGALSASAAAGDIQTYTIDATALDLPDVHGVRGFRLESQLDAIYNAYTSYDADAETITFVGSGSITAVADVTCSYQKQPTDNERGDFEAGTSTSTPNAQSDDTIVIPEVNVAMNSEAIVAKTRKLKAQWTPEFAQDLNAYHSLDAEAELTSIMSEYISLEIDLEILGMLKESAPTVEYWSAQNNVALDSSGVASADLGFLNTQGGWFQTLGTKVQKVSNTIHQKTMRGGANFMVVSPSIATVIESIPGYASNSDGGDKDTFAFGIQKAGTMNGRYKVYKNPYQQDNMILMGYRGSQFLECGAVFAPYIPLIMTPLIYDPETFTPRKGLLTRYAKKMIRPEFYGKIFVSGLNTI